MHTYTPLYVHMYTNISIRARLEYMKARHFILYICTASVDHLSKSPLPYCAIFYYLCTRGILFRDAYAHTFVAAWSRVRVSVAYIRMLRRTLRFWRFSCNKFNIFCEWQARVGTAATKRLFANLLILAITLFVSFFSGWI